MGLDSPNTSAIIRSSRPHRMLSGIVPMPYVKLVLLCARKQGTRRIRAAAPTGIRSFKMVFPIVFPFGRSGRCFVLSIHLQKHRVSAGRNSMTLRKLRRIPLARLIPRSEPIRNFIKTSARKPNRVVAALAAIDVKDSFMASFMASVSEAQVFLCRSKLCSRKIA